MACPTSPVQNPVVGFFSFLGDPIGTIVDGIGRAILAAAVSVFGALVQAVPTLSTGSAPTEINSQTQWIVVYVAVGSLIFAAIRMALERRGEAGQVALKGLLRVVFVAGAGTALVGAFGSLSDRFADHLFRQGAQAQIAAIGCGDASSLRGFLLLILALLLLVAGIVHTILLYIRLGVMIILLGTLPIAAAASMTDWGSGWWRKHIGWMIAWLLYKPAAALVIFAGSEMTAADGIDAVHVQIAGIGVMLLSAIALPALLRVVVPATAALGGGAAMQKGTTAAVGALASGAKSIGSSGGGGQSSGPGPSGASGVSGGGQGPGGAGGARGAGMAGAAGAAGTAGAALGAAASVAKGVGQVAAGSLDGADGAAGHNQ